MLALFLTGLAERGLLADSPLARHGDLAEKAVWVEGDDPIAALVADLLEPHVKVTRGLLDRAELDGLDLAISCAGWLPDVRWQQVDRWCGDAGVAWHRCHAEGVRFQLGPMFVPGHTASYADVRARRLAATRVPDELRGLWAYLDRGQGLPPVPWPDPGGLAVVAGALVGDALAYLSGSPVPSFGHQLCISGAELDIERHPVLPVPASGHRSVATEPKPTVALSSLIDARLGLITRVTREPAVPGIPRAFVDYTADVAATGQFAPWVADAVTGGATLDEPERAREAAIGEAVERYCGNAVPDDLVVGSAASLTAQGLDVLDPAGLALYSATQYAQPGFPFVPLTRELEISWTPGRDLGSGNEVLVPAALVYLNLHRARPGRERAIIFQACAGIAAGDGLEAAERSALEELIERDAVTIWWHSGAEATALDIGDDPFLTSVLADPEAADLRVTFLAIPSVFDVPMVGAFLQDHARGLVGFGSACRATAQAAAAKALTEAIVGYSIGRELGTPESEFWIAVRSGRLSQDPYRDFRADRAYRGEFRDDWHDLNTLDPNLQLYLDPAMQGDALRRLRAPPSRQPLSTVVSVSGDPRATYLDGLARQGLQAISVDVTTPDVARTGLRVVRVLVPGLYQSSPAAFPMLGGTRLYTEPVAGGWVRRPFTEHDVIRHPLPFA
ncbi:MAG: YcaO-like family protein [Pseudonocardia sp.]